MKNEIKTIDVYDEDQQSWLKYTYEEFSEYFTFVTKPVLQFIEEIYLHNASPNIWMEIHFKKNGYSNVKIYNNIYGTYVPQ